MQSFTAHGNVETMSVKASGFDTRQCGGTRKNVVLVSKSKRDERNFVDRGTASMRLRLSLHRYRKRDLMRLCWKTASMTYIVSHEDDIFRAQQRLVAIGF